jgi:hypothetical protein
MTTSSGRPGSSRRAGIVLAWAAGSGGAVLNLTPGGAPPGSR